MIQSASICGFSVRRCDPAMTLCAMPSCLRAFVVATVRWCDEIHNSKFIIQIVFYQSGQGLQSQVRTMASRCFSSSESSTGMVFARFSPPRYMAATTRMITEGTMT